MNIEIKIDNKYKENKIVIQVNEMTKEILNVIDILKTINQERLKVFLNEETCFISEDEIETIYSNNKKVYIKTESNQYISKQRLYELEKILPCKDFIRISNSEIINLNKVKSINTKFTGTIVITFYSEYKTYSSRRYISKIKEALNI